MRKAFLERAVVELVYHSMRTLPQMFEKVSRPLKCHSNFFGGSHTYIREYGSTLYVGLARAVSPTNTNFRLTFLLTRLQEALYEDLAV